MRLVIDVLFPLAGLDPRTPPYEALRRELKALQGARTTTDLAG